MQNKKTKPKKQSNNNSNKNPKQNKKPQRTHQKYETDFHMHICDSELWFWQRMKMKRLVSMGWLI